MARFLPRGKRAPPVQLHRQAPRVRAPGALPFRRRVRAPDSRRRLRPPVRRGDGGRRPRDRHALERPARLHGRRELVADRLPPRSRVGGGAARGADVPRPSLGRAATRTTCAASCARRASRPAPSPTRAPRRRRRAREALARPRDRDHPRRASSTGSRDSEPGPPPPEHALRVLTAPGRALPGMKIQSVYVPPAGWPVVRDPSSATLRPGPPGARPA